MGATGVRVLHVSPGAMSKSCLPINVPFSKALIMVGSAWPPHMSDNGVRRIGGVNHPMNRWSGQRMRLYNEIMLQLRCNHLAAK